VLIAGAGNANPLQLPARQLLALGEQPVSQIQLGKYRPGAGNVQRMQQVDHAAAQTPLTEPPSQHRGDYPLARWQGWRLMDQADTSAQALPCPRRQPPGILLQ